MQVPVVTTSPAPRARSPRPGEFVHQPGQRDAGIAEDVGAVPSRARACDQPRSRCTGCAARSSGRHGVARRAEHELVRAGVVGDQLGRADPAGNPGRANRGVSIAGWSVATAASTSATEYGWRAGAGRTRKRNANSGSATHSGWRRKEGRAVLERPLTKQTAGERAARPGGDAWPAALVAAIFQPNSGLRAATGRVAWMA